MALIRSLCAVTLFGLSAYFSLARGAVPKDGNGNPSAPEVHVIGVYEGAYPAGVWHRFGFHPNGRITVKVGEVKTPIVLVLTSYEPVVWKVEAPKGAVVRVIASGYHKQTVEGLEEKMPITRL